MPEPPPYTQYFVTPCRKIDDQPLPSECYVIFEWSFTGAKRWAIHKNRGHVIIGILPKIKVLLSLSHLHPPCTLWPMLNQTLIL